MNKFDMDRQMNNEFLLYELEYLINIHPEMRFSQILLAFGFVKQERPARPEARISWQDEFYLEPDKILERVRKRIKDVEASQK